MAWRVLRAGGVTAGMETAEGEASEEAMRTARRWWLPGVPTRGPAGVASPCLPAQAAAVSGEEQMGW